jgi:Fe-S cluster biogenesis protein NfuA/nitrite reductase/ring-hydroxylating ferredoxin subunit
VSRTTMDDPRRTGQRIEELLGYFAGSPPPAGERAEELAGAIATMYGDGLERLLEILHDSGALTDDVLDRLADDPLVAGLLVVHGLHPHDLPTRVERALEGVRPYLRSHGGDVTLLGIGTDGVVHLRLVGSCQSCPSSSVTLELAVQDAIESAAPDVTGIACEDVPPAAAAGTVIPVEALLQRTRAVTPAAPAGAVWETVDASDLAPGRVHLVVVQGQPVAFCRISADGPAYAFADACPSCNAGLAGGSLQRAPGSRLGTAILTCPGCREHYDVSRAGAGIDDPSRHLYPLPVLERAGRLEIAVPDRATSLPAAGSEVPA